MRAGPPWTLTPTTSAGPGEDRLPGLALQGPQLALVLGCGMGLVQQQPLVAQESGCVFIYAYLSWERAEGGAPQAWPALASPVLLPVLWPFPWLQV